MTTFLEEMYQGLHKTVLGMKVFQERSSAEDPPFVLRVCSASDLPAA